MYMKRFSQSGSAVCDAPLAALFALVFLALAGCSSPGGGDTTTPSLAGIEATTTKTGYLLGQDLDLSTITVVGTYTDGTTMPIPIADAAIAGYDKTRAGDQIVTVTVEEKSDAFTVTVTDQTWSYTVYFDLNDGAGTSPETQTVASPDTTVGSLPAMPVRSGYTFSGWNTKADGTGSAFTGTTPVTRDLTVYARWTADEAPLVNAQAPAISAQPQGGTYTAGVAVTLSVTAASSDGGTLSYQWRSALSGGSWTAIDGATAASYTPPTDTVGTINYHVRITNTNNNATGTKTAILDSGVATITVNAAPVVNAQAPVISVQPQAATYTVGDTAAALTVTAESPDGGELSYRWQSAPVGGTWAAIENAVESSYTPPVATVSVLSYYVIVTNTNTEVNGNKTASANSDPVVITVKAAEPPEIVNARAPVISAQPQAATYTVGDAAAALSVTASSPDGGVLSYQWHSAPAGGAWTAIGNATAASYTPPATTAGTLSYYVIVTNTNNSVNGTKTAVTNSATAAVTVNPVPIVNAQAPAISVQPQGGTFDVGAAVTLSVTAASPDGGTLSYQWHSAVSGGSWTAIGNAVAASYTPPTATEGTVSYYVIVTNTNNGVNGTKTASTNSGTATVTITTVGTGGFSYTAWVNGDDGLISDMPEYFDISKSDFDTLTITVAADLTGAQWSINGIDLAAPQGTAQSITIEAINYALGDYTLGLYAEKDTGGDTVPYSINITFMVVN